MDTIQTVELTLDVTAAANINEPAHQAATVVLPPASKLPQTPIICFARPGVQYNRLYYTHDLPGEGPGSEAHYHAAHGWIFVALDYLGAGDSSNNDGSKLTYATVARAFLAAETEVLRQLAEGELLSGYPKVTDVLKIGVGQSMGGALAIVQTGRYHCYDGVAILGASAIHTHPPGKPGEAGIVAPWLARDTAPGEPPVVLNQKTMEEFYKNRPPGYKSSKALVWSFHYDDVDPALVADDFQRYDRDVGDASEVDRGDQKVVVPPWGCFNTPASAAMASVTPGAVAPEAAAITCPVLVAMGERDVIADPKGEPRAYHSAISVDLYVVPRMGHMHNFAGTRELLWKRIETWAEWVRAVKEWEKE
ncbi:uncharacterized protein BDZ99DRAFT_523037 [Mytilinidion resinicola]|uniref:Alpha/beta-hydrolase n=1 Tax=Mytilinidion resinicola TaxID=574789 RepID=A0A6A6YFP4_9PEZI|nr:uncharacterized protein BDZ99DRAFT_523037 [Mytilinidion resinicola]KAF2807419.1 hypothetical protein BDZ99DRAFT_523037 [Mytilinidion resinicola]